MRRYVIANSTPIISLLGIGRLDILKALYGAIVIPKAVYNEVVAKDARVLDGYSWIRVVPISNIEAKETFISALHDGEVEVIILAKEHSSDLVIIDDSLARQHAKYHGLTITGTIGVLLRAKHDGILSAVKPALDDLLEFGFYISADVISDVLRLAGEL